MPWLLERLEAGICEVTKLPFVMVSKDPFSPSLDRIEAGGPYTKINCRLVALIYNLARNNFSDEALLKLATALTVGSF
jgi:hypothetical protein